MTFQSSCRVSKTFRSFFDAAADVCRRILRGLRSPSGPTELLRRTRSASRRWKTDHPSRDRPNRKKTGRRAAQPPRLHTARPGCRAKGPRAGLKDSRQCAGRLCGGGAHGSDRCSKLRGAAQAEQTNTPSIGRPSVCRPGRRPAANDSPSQRNGPQDLFREKVQRLS